MNPKRFLSFLFAVGSVVTLGLGLSGCAEETTRSPATGPGVENSAASGGGEVIPSVGSAGNGGGVSGGGAGVGSAGQGGR